MSGWRIGIAQNQHAAPPQVAREQQLHFAAILRGTQKDGRRPQNMPGIVTLVTQTRAQLLGRVVRDRLQQWQCAVGVIGSVERVGGRQPRAVVPFVKKFDVFLQDVRRVKQHGVCQVDGGGGTVDRPTESVLHQQRKSAAVIDVRVRKNHRVSARCGKRKVPVAFFGFFPVALIHPAIQQVAFAVGFHLMHGPGDSPCGSPKGKFHREFANCAEPAKLFASWRRETLQAMVLIWRERRSPVPSCSWPMSQPLAWRGWRARCRISGISMTIASISSLPNR